MSARENDASYSPTVLCPRIFPRSEQNTGLSYVNVAVKFHPRISHCNALEGTAQDPIQHHPEVLIFSR